VALALLRGAGLPARYVSGYIHRQGEESQSHAWCEAWVPDVGWVGLDPTNDINWVASISPEPLDLFAEGKVDAVLARGRLRRGCGRPARGRAPGAWSS